MAQKRTAQNLAEFVKFATVGAVVFGVVTRHGRNGNGPFLVMTPAGYRANGRDPFTRFAELAVGLSTDLANKVSESDVGKVMLLAFVGTRPTNKDPMKLFNVFEITPEEARQLMGGAKVPAEFLACDESTAAGSKATADPIF